MDKVSNSWPAISLTKMTGTGNSFLFLDLRERSNQFLLKARFNSTARANLAKSACGISFGIGADGLVILEESRKCDVRWDFYNADGSRAEFCGNAARCMGLYESRKRGDAKEIRFESRLGIVSVQVESDKIIGVRMPKVQAIEMNQRVRVNAKNVSFHFLNTGVPHAVVPLSKWDMNVQAVARMASITEIIRKLRRFKKFGTNVTFYAPRSSTGKTSAIDSLTFERGVPGYTMACGTGAVAAAGALALSEGPNKTVGSVSVYVPGGHLEVLFSASAPLLVGPAEKTAEIRFKYSGHIR